MPVGSRETTIATSICDIQEQSLQNTHRKIHSMMYFSYGKTSSFNPSDLAWCTTPARCTARSRLNNVNTARYAVSLKLRCAGMLDSALRGYELDRRLCATARDNPSMSDQLSYRPRDRQTLYLHENTHRSLGYRILMQKTPHAADYESGLYARPGNTYRHQRAGVDMRRSPANTVWLHASAVLSLACWALVIVGANEYVKRYKANLGPPTERDVWEGGDVVQAIRQRTQTAALYLQGFAFSMVIIIIGATAQSLLAFRQTKDFPAALRSFLQVELVYQIFVGHRTGSKTSVAEQESRERVAHLCRMSNCCIFFLLGLLGYMVSFIGVLQRPLRATVRGRDLNTVWVIICLIFIGYIAVTVAQHVGDAEWSFWHTRPKPVLMPHTPKADQQSISSHDQPTLPDRPGHDARDSTAPKLEEESNVVPRRVLKGILRFIVCFVSLLTHLYVYLLFAVAIRSVVLAIVVGHWIVSSLVYYAVTRQVADSLYWGFLSFMMHIGFNRMTHHKAWWVAVATTILFSTVSIVCGILQLRLYVFTKRYTTAEYTGGTNTQGHVRFESSVGLSAVGTAAADLLVQAIVVLVHLRSGNAGTYEAEVQTSTIA